MTRVSADTLINLSHAACWDKLRDLTQAVHYVPGVTQVEIITPEQEGVGASRIVTLNHAPHAMEETVTAWEEGRGFTLHIHKNGKPAIPVLKSFYFHYQIEPAGAQTRFSPAMEFTPKFGLIGRMLLEKPLRKRLQQTVQLIARSMAEYYETGEPTSPERIKVLQGEVRE